jgi:hypothetical protein
MNQENSGRLRQNTTVCRRRRWPRSAPRRCKSLSSAACGLGGGKQVSSTLRVETSPMLGGRPRGIARVGKARLVVVASFGWSWYSRLLALSLNFILVAPFTVLDLHGSSRRVVGQWKVGRRFTDVAGRVETCHGGDHVNGPRPRKQFEASGPACFHGEKAFLGPKISSLGSFVLLADEGVEWRDTPTDFLGSMCSVKSS